MEYSAIAVVIVGAVQDAVASSDDDFSEDEDVIYCFGNWREQTKIARIEDYVETTVLRMIDDTFRSHFRIRRDTLEYLINLLGADLAKQSDRYGRHPSPVEKQLLLVLWTMSTPDSYRSVCDRFNVGKAIAWRTMWKFVKAIYKYLPMFIRWPMHEEADKTCIYMYRKHGFPKVLGAVDGTHIRIAEPKNNSNSYVNRKGFHSIQMQLVCDHKLKFIYVYAGEVGSVHDARVFRLSGLQSYCTPEYFPENSHLLGDKAYSIRPCIIVPFRNNGNLDGASILYNNVHSAAQLMVERSIGLLKGRFRSLLDKLPFKRTDMIPFYIVACCILHNICILRDDLTDIPILINDNVPGEAALGGDDSAMKLAGKNKRKRLREIINNP